MNSNELNVDVPLATVESDSEEIEVTIRKKGKRVNGWSSASILSPRTDVVSSDENHSFSKI